MSDLKFLADPEMREVLRLDLASAEEALAHAEWKAATVLAGAVIEALLLEAIDLRAPAEVEAACKAVKRQCPSWKSPESASLYNWNLSQYVEVGHQLKIIKESARNLCNEAREFRNLIHPGRSQRVGMRCSKATAFGALSAVYQVIDDLS